MEQTPIKCVLSLQESFIDNQLDLVSLSFYFEKGLEGDILSCKKGLKKSPLHHYAPCVFRDVEMWKFWSIPMQLKFASVYCIWKTFIYQNFKLKAILNHCH